MFICETVTHYDTLAGFISL